MRLHVSKTCLIAGPLTALIRPVWAASKEDLTQWVNPLIVRIVYS
jgi:hypothetical protein